MWAIGRLAAIDRLNHIAFPQPEQIVRGHPNHQHARVRTEVLAQRGSDCHEAPCLSVDRLRNTTLQNGGGMRCRFVDLRDEGTRSTPWFLGAAEVHEQILSGIEEKGFA